MMPNNAATTENDNLEMPEEGWSCMDRFAETSKSTRPPRNEPESTSNDRLASCVCQIEVGGLRRFSQTSLPGGARPHPIHTSPLKRFGCTVRSCLGGRW